MKLSKKKTKPETQMMPPGEISYSQLDLTENFGDNERLKPDDWILTAKEKGSVPHNRTFARWIDNL